MPHITPIRWQKFEKFLLYTGCEFVRERGDHRIYWRSDLSRPIVLPRYNPLPVFIIRNNLKTLKLHPETYLQILEQV